MGVSVPLRVISVPFAQTRPPAQFLALLLCDLLELSLPLRLSRSSSVYATMEKATTLSTREFRSTNAAHPWHRSSIWKTSRRPCLRVVRADRRLRRFQQSVHFPGTPSYLFYHVCSADVHTYSFSTSYGTHSSFRFLFRSFSCRVDKYFCTSSFGWAHRRSG